MDQMTLRQLSKCLIQRMMGTQYAEINQTIKICSNIFSFIDIEELMSVMVMLGNPRTEEEVRRITQSEA